MACFIVPVAEAVATTAVVHKMHGEHHEGKGMFSARKLAWLRNMLWVSSAISCAEHIYNGEVIASFPFLTALRTWESTQVMLQEIATEGVLIALAVTAIWGVVAYLTEYADAKVRE